MTMHVVDDLHEYALDILEPRRGEEVRSHLQVCRQCLMQLGVVNDQLVEAVMPAAVMPAAGVAPAPSLRSRLLGDVSAISPYASYHTQMARLLRSSEDAVSARLRGMPHPATWMDGPIPDCRLWLWAEGAQPQDAIVTLVLMESGSRFPTHEHLGEERVLVVQGSMLNDDGKLYRPGDELHLPGGSSHAFDVPEGLDLVYLAIAEQGVRIGDLLLTPDTL